MVNVNYFIVNSVITVNDIYGTFCTCRYDTPHTLTRPICHKSEACEPLFYTQKLDEKPKRNKYLNIFYK